MPHWPIPLIRIEVLYPVLLHSDSIDLCGNPAALDTYTYPRACTYRYVLYVYTMVYKKTTQGDG